MPESLNLLQAAIDVKTRHENLRTIERAGVSLDIIGPTGYPGVYVVHSEKTKKTRDKSIAHMRNVFARL